MRIKGTSVQLFFPVFLRYRSPSSSVSETSTTTMFNILTTYVKLARKTGAKKISVTDIVKKSGYSRTTFYTYFADVQEIIEMLEEMISYHMYINADIYLNCFLGNLDPDEEEEMLESIEDFGPYIHALMLNSPGFQSRYNEDFRKAFKKAISRTSISENIRDTLINATCAAMVHLITEHLNGNEPATFRVALEATKIIFQNINNA